MQGLMEVIGITHLGRDDAVTAHGCVYNQKLMEAIAEVEGLRYVSQRSWLSAGDRKELEVEASCCVAQ
jgi:hypothetical protein